MGVISVQSLSQSEIFYALRKLLVAHAELVTKDVLVTRENHNLGGRRLVRKNARIQHKFNVAVVDSGVVGASVWLNIFGVRRIRPYVDKVLLLVRTVARNVRVVLVRLH